MNKQDTEQLKQQLKQDVKDLRIVMLGTKDDIKKRYGWQ